MAKIKSAFEKAMEKAAEMGEFTPEEKERIKSQERVRLLLADFYRGQIDRNGLWQKLKGSPHSLLKEAQKSLIESLGLASTEEEFKIRKDGILAIETLKEKQKISVVESILNTLGLLQQEYRKIKEDAYTKLREAAEKNPQLRLQPIRTPDGRTVYQAALSVDEAVQARLGEFLSEHEKSYSIKFGRLVEKLKKEIG
ncbi:MAG: hypothetical protein AB1390_01220 [Nitrospirota bacterium]